MKLTYWIYFENPGEKEKLINIMNGYHEEFEQIEQIQKEFGIDIVEASRIIDVANSKQLNK